MEHMDENASGESDDEDGFDEGDADDADEGGEDDEEDEDDEETAEKKAKIRQFASEIKQLELAIEKKRAGFQGGNPIMIVSCLLQIENALADTSETFRRDDSWHADRHPY